MTAQPTESTASTGTIRVELFLRNHGSAAVVDPLRRVVARARRLEDEIGATVRVETWASVRPAIEELSDSGTSTSLTVDAFRSWAEREGYTLRPSFERHETPSMLGQCAVEIRVPNVCVAVYEDGDLQCVAPCADRENEKRTYTVERCLDALEAGVTEPFVDDDPQSTDDEDAVERRGDTE